jgi:putative transposase
LFVISIGRRRLECVACTSKPDTAWMMQQARNLLINLDSRGQRPRFVIRDRDSKFSRAFDAIFPSEEITIIRTPIQAPNANAHAERWVGSARRECLDRLLIFNRRQLERVLGVYVQHDNMRRPHRALDLGTPDSSSTPAARGRSHLVSPIRPTVRHARRTPPRIRGCGSVTEFVHPRVHQGRRPGWGPSSYLLLGIP